MGAAPLQRGWGAPARLNRALLACSTAASLLLQDVEDVKREVDILHLVSPHATVAGLKSVYEDRGAGASTCCRVLAVSGRSPCWRCSAGPGCCLATPC